MVDNNGDILVKKVVFREGIDVPFDVVFTVKEYQIVEKLIKNIDESNVTVKSIGFPVQPLISANSAQSDASLDAAW